MNIPFLMAGYHGQSQMIAQVVKGLGLFVFGGECIRQMAMMPPVHLSGDIIAEMAGNMDLKPARGGGNNAGSGPDFLQSEG